MLRIRALLLLASLLSTTTALGQGLHVDTNIPEVRLIQDELDRQTRQLPPVTPNHVLSVIVAGDRETANEILVDRQIGRMEAMATGPTLYSRAQNLNDVVESLRMREGDVLQLVMFAGLHSNDDYNSDDSLLLGIPPAEVLSTLDLQEHIRKLPTSERPRYLPSALVTFSACSLIPRPNRGGAVIQRRFELISKALGLTQGWIYANYTGGGDGVETYFFTPTFFDSLWPIRLLQQLQAPVTFPVAYILDRFIGNHGLLYGFTRDRYVLLKTHYNQVRNGTLGGQLFSSGPRLEPELRASGINEPE